MKLPSPIRGFGGIYRRDYDDNRGTRFQVVYRDRANKRKMPEFETAREAADFFYKAYREWPGRSDDRIDYTIGEMVGEYLAHREAEFALGRVCGGPACRSKTGRVAESTMVADRAAGAAVIAGLGTRQADDPLARAAIKVWLADEEKAGDRRSKTPGGGLSTRAIAARASVLRRAYTYAIEDTEVIRVPSIPVPRVKVTYKGGGRHIDPADLDALRRAVDPHYRVVVDTLLATGMRINEVCSLNVGDLRVEDGVGRVRGGSKTEAGRNRVVVLPEWLTRNLFEMLVARYDGNRADPGDPLFVNRRGGRVTPDPFRRRVWHPAIARAGLPAGITPHSLRHTLATRAARQGRSIWEMMEHFGWADARQAKTYVHLAREGISAMADLTEEMGA